LERIGKATYKFLLPPDSQLHNVFHASELKRHLGSKVVPTLGLPLIDDKGTIKVAPEAILERKMVPGNNAPMVQWLIHMPPEQATWEGASFIHKVFPSFHP
jgi:hypothetical protein